jgi:hypothetical protein
VQQKLEELLGPVVVQLLKNAGGNISRRTTTESFTDSDDKTPSKGAVTPLSDDVTQGIRFLLKNESKGDGSLPWHDPRKPPTLEEGTTERDWLIVTKDEDDDSVDYKIEICDKALRDRISSCLSPFIAHVGENVWQQESVVLDSEIKTLVLNHEILEREAARHLDTTGLRLRELLQIIRAIHPPSMFTKIDAIAERDFRIQIECIGPFFRPGKYIVANVQGFDSPQLMKIDNHYLKMQEQQQVSLTVHAWIWDWDGRKLVRSAYSFRQIVPENTRVDPKEWSFYPVEFYEASDGTRGLPGLRQDVELRKRRELFIEFTGEYAAKYQGANVLRYSGDAFGDAPAFRPAFKPGPLESFFLAFSSRIVRDERPESKLVKVSPANIQRCEVC